MSRTSNRDPATDHEPDVSKTVENNPCDEALISRQRQRYLASLPSEGEAQIDNQYREQ